MRARKMAYSDVGTGAGSANPTTTSPVESIQMAVRECSVRAGVLAFWMLSEGLLVCVLQCLLEDCVQALGLLGDITRDILEQRKELAATVRDVFISV